MNFGEVRRVQLAKSSLLIFTLETLGSFQICSEDKERVWCGKQREAFFVLFEVLGRVNISGHWRPQSMSMDDNDGQMIFGDLGGLKLPRKLVPTGDRTRARSVTSAHATTCSTAVDATGSYCIYSSLVKLRPCFLSLWWKTWLWVEQQPLFLSLQWKTCPCVEHPNGGDDDHYCE